MFVTKEFCRKAMWKILVIILLLFFHITMLKSSISVFYDRLISNDVHSEAASMDRLVNEGKYSDLRTHMILFDSYDEIFDSYWEIADVYQYLSDYMVWKKAYEELEENREEYKVLMEESLQKILVLSKNSIFEKNRVIFDYFLEETENGK